MSDVRGWVDDNIDLKVLEGTIKSTVDSFKDDITEEDGKKEYYIESLVLSHYGRYITKELADMFGLSYDDYKEDFDWLVDEVDSFAGEVSEELNKRLSVEGEVYLGYIEGDYGIIYIEYTF